MPEPMSDERLAEFEARAEACSHPKGHCFACNYAEELIAEVRRLRRALQLSEASRGVPSRVGRD
jgi:hypothetical protein